MDFERIFDEGLALATYVIGCGAAGEAVVVDPPRDIERAMQAAEKLGLRIVGVAETHIHADFLSGARQLAHTLEVPFYHSAEAPEDWQYQHLDGLLARPLQDRDAIRVGNVRLIARHTPGHTPEHMSYLVEDNGELRMLLSGDFVFVGDVGRPDLLDTTGSAQDTSRQMARTLFESLQQVFCTLPEGLVVWPGHGAGSACGKSMSQLPCTSVGFEREHAWWAEHVRRGQVDAFIEALLSGQPETPRYFARMKRLNRDGAPPLPHAPQAPLLYPARARELYEQGAVLLDTRALEARCITHDALRFRSLEKLSDHAGRVLDPDASLLLIDTEERARQAAQRLARVGLEVAGHVPSQESLGLEARAIPVIDAARAHALHEGGEVAFLDVRAASEWEEGHVPGAAHIHYGELPDRLDELPREKPLVVYCGSGVRATLAASILRRADPERELMVFEPGFGAW